MFAHFNAEEILDVQELIFRLNSFLPKDISVNDLFRVTDEAHARFDAVAREYQYVISLKKDPFREDFAYHIHQEPSVTLMNEAAAMLLSYKDFQCFSRSNTDVKTYYCTIQKAAWEQEESQLVFTIVADRFLRNMVRAIVGTLLDVGFEKISRQDFKDIIESKDRTKAGASAPAHGLYLTKVVYPETIKR